MFCIEASIGVAGQRHKWANPVRELPGTVSRYNAAISRQVSRLVKRPHMISLNYRSALTRMRNIEETIAEVAVPHTALTSAASLSEVFPGETPHDRYNKGHSHSRSHVSGVH